MRAPCVAFNFSHYLEDVEQGLVTSNVLDPDTEEIHTSKVNLAYVLQFVTGCDAIPAIGFDTSLKWYYDENHIFPIEDIFKYKQVLCMRRKMPFIFFKYLFSFQRYSSF